MMDRHCVNKMSVIVLLQPMDCQRAEYVHGGAEQVFKEAGWTKSDESSCFLSATLDFTPSIKAAQKWKKKE